MEQVSVKWMWGDAGVSKLLAMANPLRWSPSSSIDTIEKELLFHGKTLRPVVLRISGDTDHTFVDPLSARAWLLGLSSLEDNNNSNQDEEYRVPGKSLLLGLSMKFLSVPGLTVFLRFLSSEKKRTWGQNNLFSAYSYATKVVNKPYLVASVQSEECLEKRELWSNFFSSKDAALVVFIHAVQCLEDDRPESVNFDGASWRRFDAATQHDLFCAYVCDAQAIVAFRGGDADHRPGDMKRHVGSPIRAYVQADSLDREPSELLPIDLIQSLLEKKFSVTVVAFSQGVIGAIAVAFKFPALSRVVLFNSARFGVFMFFAILF